MICNSSQSKGMSSLDLLVRRAPGDAFGTLLTSQHGMDALSEEIQPAHLPQIKLSRYLLRNRGVGFNNDVQASFGWILPSERSFFSTLDLYIDL